VAEVEGAEDEVEEVADEVDEAARKVLVATNPEDIAKYATKEAGAGAANVSIVGSSQSGLPLPSIPQQCHIWVVVFQTTSGLPWSTVRRGSVTHVYFRDTNALLTTSREASRIREI